MSNSNNAPVKPRLPRGLQDRNAGDLAATDKMLAKIREVYELYGFAAVETPFIEYTEALGKFLPDTDRPNEGVFSFQDDDEQWMSLRYDLTAPLARYVAENFDALPKPYRSYRSGYVFRNEKPGPGRFRQFMQFDADTVGTASVSADAEICMMAADTLEGLGIKRGDYVIKVNHRKVLDGVMEAIGLGGAENVGRRLTVLRALDKYDRLHWAGVEQLLGSGRRDESGDFTKGAGLNEDQIRPLRAFFEISEQSAESFASLPIWEQDDSAFIYREFDQRAGGFVDQIFSTHVPGSLPIKNQQTIELMRAWLPQTTAISQSLDELNAISNFFEAGQYGSKRVRIDFSVVRGLEYYTGPVFEAELTFEVKGDDGKPVRFGSVGGGGRYDGLVGRFRPDSVPATGFSIGVSRLFAALKAIKSPIVTGTEKPGPVVVLVMDKGQEGHYLVLVQKLREANIPAEMYLGSAGMNAQLKYADKRGSLVAVIQGSNEREKGEVTIKDLVLGAQLGFGSKDRADYLELKQKAQFAVLETEMVAAVRKVLARHE